MHPLVRDLYKRVLIVGNDYPHPRGLVYVKEKWKTALRNPDNCPSCYQTTTVPPHNKTNSDNNNNPATATTSSHGDNHKTVLPLASLTSSPQCEKELLKAVARGRFMVREMVGVIQLKKYRTMKQRYGSISHDDDRLVLQQAMNQLEEKNKTQESHFH